ncbi:MAG TPA: type II toxin-antitoxin system VapC family toxin [Rhizomicrobium sp.]|jgi:ribonuclease VapC
MIVVDASAAVALILAESAQPLLAARLVRSPDRVMSPVSYAELVMVLSRADAKPKLLADAFLREAGIGIEPIDQRQTELAIQAFLRFGKGRHPARLNLGDCFSYAASKARDAPLLFVGNDFGRTDVRCA